MPEEWGRALTSPLQSPDVVASLFRRHIGRESVECFVVAMFDSRARLLEMILVHRGTLTEVSVHPREVFRPAIQAGAKYVIVAHNHPSGDPTPSPADHELTTRLVEAGKLAGIPMVDHIVVSSSGYKSIAQMGGL